MGTAEKPVRSSLAAGRVLDIFDAIQSVPDGIPLHELARRTGIPKATLLRYLSTLVTRGYVERDPLYGEYRLGLAAPSQAQLYAELSLAAHPAMVGLESQFGEMVVFTVLDRDRVLALDVVESSQVIRLAVPLQDRTYLHSTAAGKALAARLPERTIRALLATSGMPKLTEKTITDLDVFMDELENVRMRGYAIGDQENEIGTRAVAVALPTRRAHCALSISAVASRFPRKRVPAAAAALVEAADEVAHRMEARQSPQLPDADASQR
jgi:IclR family transcriptional regulator, acetate operon repressor